MGSKPRVTPLY